MRTNRIKEALLASAVIGALFGCEPEPSFVGRQGTNATYRNAEENEFCSRYDNALIRMIAGEELNPRWRLVVDQGVVKVELNNVEEAGSDAWRVECQCESDTKVRLRAFGSDQYLSTDHSGAAVLGPAHDWEVGKKTSSETEFSFGNGDNEFIKVLANASVRTAAGEYWFTIEPYE